MCVYRQSRVPILSTPRASPEPLTSPLPSPHTHTQTGLAAKGAEQPPPPSKLEVAKELATLMLADRAVAEQVGLDWLPSPPLNLARTKNPSPHQKHTPKHTLRQGLKPKCEASVVAFGTDETMHSIQDLGAFACE